MKKIGLLTFPRYYNYGTYLQMFALQTVIQNIGYVCDVIDYDPFSPLRYNITTTNKISQQLKRLGRILSNPSAAMINYKARKYQRQFEIITMKRQQLFLSFLDNHINIGTKKYLRYEDLEIDPPSCDAFVVGSDQVWNPISHFMDDSFYLAFAKRHQRVAYAPSIGLSRIPDNAMEWVKSGINGIAHLSIREEQGATLIRELTGREALVVADPTLLLTSSEWLQSFSLPSIRRSSYVLCYFLESDSYMRERAIEIAKTNGLDLVIIPVNPVDVEGNNNIFNMEYDVGPKEFLSLIKNASFVCTDSFHGTVFSIVFRRPFFTFRRYANLSEAALHSRISNILIKLGLEKREVGHENRLSFSLTEMDYEYAEKYITDWQDLSKTYLYKALMKATQEY